MDNNDQIRGRVLWSGTLTMHDVKPTRLRIRRRAALHYAFASARAGDWHFAGRWLRSVITGHCGMIYGMTR